MTEESPCKCGHINHTLERLAAAPTIVEVERAARALMEWDVEEHPEPAPTWGTICEQQKDVWRSGAIIALRAARGLA